MKKKNSPSRALQPFCQWPHEPDSAWCGQFWTDLTGADVPRRRRGISGRKKKSAKRPQRKMKKKKKNRGKLNDSTRDLDYPVIDGLTCDVYVTSTSRRRRRTRDVTTARQERQTESKSVRRRREKRSRAQTNQIKLNVNTCIYICIY